MKIETVKLWKNGEYVIVEPGTETAAGFEAAGWSPKEAKVAPVKKARKPKVKAAGGGK